MPRCKRSSRRLFRCGGACGNPACGYTTVSVAHLKRHTTRSAKKTKVACPHCKKKLAAISKHIRSQHPEHAAPKKAKSLPCPFPDDLHGWSFVKLKVHSCIKNDLRKKHRWTFPGDCAELEAQNCNAAKHALAKKVYGRWLSMSETDDAGGVVPGGLKLRFHSLFQLSLDRKDNSRPHFIGNSLENLSFVVLGINTPASIVSRWGGETCAELRKRVMAPVTEAEVEDILQREKKSMSSLLARMCGKPTRINNVVYNVCTRVYHRDKMTRAQFESAGAFFKHAYALLVDQRARCDTSTILMSEHCYTDSSAFQPSLDAIVPSLGHVKGNLRWVCACLNSTDHSKKNKSPDGEPQSWTPALFRQYIGL